jgi:hypothetical protein
MAQPVDRTDHLERWVEAKKSFQEILLIPHMPVLDYPLGEIIIGREDIVHMDENAGRQASKDM